MNAVVRIIAVSLIFLASAPALAFIELNTFYYTDDLQTATNSKASNMFIEASIGFAIDKKMAYLVGWNYSMMNVTETSTTTTKYASTQMGPRFVWRIGKSQNWSLGLGYYLLTDATYDGSGTEVKWEGTTMKVDFGYSFEVATDVQLGLRGNYAASSYNEQLVGSATYSTISYKRTHMYPSLYLIWIW